MNHQLDDRLRALGTHLDAERAEWSGDAASPYAGRPQRSGGRSRLMLVAASVVLIAGVGGVLATRDRGDAPPTAAGADTVLSPIAATTVVAPNTTVAPTTTVVPPTTVAAPSAADRLAAYTGWYLPTYVPAGFEITNLSAGLPVESNISSGQWVRTGADGTVDATFTVSWMPDSADTEKPFVPTPGKTVHGQPALVFDSGEGLRVHWKEAGLMVMASSTGLSEADLLAGAELFVVAGHSVLPPDNTFPADTPMAGFTLVTTDPLRTDGVLLTIGLLSADGWITVSVSPNVDGATLESMTSKGGTATKVGSHDAVAYDSGNGVGSIFWLDGGTTFAVSGKAPAGELLALATGLVPVTPDAILTAGRAITDGLLALPEIDTATFADGTRVSVRGTATTGAVAICVMGDSPQCIRQVSESSLGGERQSAIFQLFESGDDRAVIGWREGAEVPTSTGAETVTGAAGVFVRATVTDLNAPPQVSFGDVSYGVATQSSTLLVGFGTGALAAG